MTKTATGVKYTPFEFRNLNKCVECGRASAGIAYGAKCDDCAVANRQKCEVCEIVLRTGKNKFFTYDNQEEYRGDSVDFKVNKAHIREFYYLREAMYPPISDTMCAGCKNWQAKIKHKCWVCKDNFNNTESNFKINGNVCFDCAEPLPDENA